MSVIVEVCAGSVEDCITASRAGADRIELNNALHMGGLTPSYATLTLAKAKTNIPIVSMVRPRGAGFHYNDIEVETMFVDAKNLLELGSDGLAFGFLDADSKIHKDLTLKMVGLCHSKNAEAVFHRAFDVVPDAYEAIETLIECGVNRILTSGLASTGIEGVEVLADLQTKYGDKIELLVGSGVNESNVKEIIDRTNIKQVHGSFKGWSVDLSTESATVSYRYSDVGDYDGVDADKLISFLKITKAL